MSATQIQRIWFIRFWGKSNQLFSSGFHEIRKDLIFFKILSRSSWVGLLHNISFGDSFDTFDNLFVIPAGCFRFVRSSIEFFFFEIAANSFVTSQQIFMIFINSVWNSRGTAIKFWYYTWSITFILILIHFLKSSHDSEIIVEANEAILSEYRWMLVNNESNDDLCWRRILKRLGETLNFHQVIQKSRLTGIWIRGTQFNWVFNFSKRFWMVSPSFFQSLYQELSLSISSEERWYLYSRSNFYGTRVIEIATLETDFFD